MDSGGTVHGIYGFDLGAGGFLNVPDHGFALVRGRDSTPFIFADTGKVVVAEGTGLGPHVEIRAGETEGQVILSQGNICYGAEVVLDLLRQEIVSAREFWCF